MKRRRPLVPLTASLAVVVAIVVWVSATGDPVFAVRATKVPNWEKTYCGWWCKQQLPLGKARRQCVSDAHRGKGLCFDCGLGGTNVGLCGGVCCPAGLVCGPGQLCVTPTPPPDTFVDNGDGTISDLQTGLMWEKKDEAGGIHDVRNEYTLSNPLTPADGTGTAFTTFLATLNTPPCFAGHCDWRLPSSANCCLIPTQQPPELESILAARYPSCPSSPCVPAAFNTNCTPGCSVTSCSCTASNGYWSGSLIVVPHSVPENACAVDFDNGMEVCPLIENNFSVRAVRGGS